MITADNDLIEQIVANVLAELQPVPVPAVRAPVVTPPFTPVKAESVGVDLDLPVITADVLAEKLRPGQTLRIGRRSVLTPSARDWLASRKISWARLTAHASATAGGTSRWQLVLTNVTPVVATLRTSLTNWKTELLGTPQEAADFATRAICTGEADGVVGLCGSAATVACLANRNPKVRAAVVSAASELPVLVDQLSPNFLVVNPHNRSLMELKNLLRAVSALQKPRESFPWASWS